MEFSIQPKTGIDPQSTDQLILFIPDKAPEYCAVLDTKDRELIYLGKDKEKAQRIVAAVNEYDNLVKENAELREWKEDQMEMTRPILDYMQKNSAKFNLKLGERIFKKVLQILEQSSIK